MQLVHRTHRRSWPKETWSWHYGCLCNVHFIQFPPRTHRCYIVFRCVSSAQPCASGETGHRHTAPDYSMAIMGFPFPFARIGLDMAMWCSSDQWNCGKVCRRLLGKTFLLLIKDALEKKVIFFWTWLYLDVKAGPAAATCDNEGGGGGWLQKWRLSSKLEQLGPWVCHWATELFNPGAVLSLDFQEQDNPFPCLAKWVWDSFILSAKNTLAGTEFLHAFLIQELSFL